MCVAKCVSDDQSEIESQISFMFTQARCETDKQETTCKLRCAGEISYKLMASKIQREKVIQILYIHGQLHYQNRNLATQSKGLLMIYKGMNSCLGTKTAECSFLGIYRLVLTHL